ncbi:MAG: hypothetical protein ACYS1A_09875 [Planctomycetota bacterium]|jgi:hypothetical protein
MNERGGIAAFFLFQLLLVIIPLQILSTTLSDRPSKRLNHLLEMRKNADTPLWSSVMR